MYRFIMMMSRLKDMAHGIGRHEMEELHKMSSADLAAMSQFLGNKLFYLGDRPSTIDCAILGHLAQFLYIDIGFPEETFLKERCPNLVRLVERLKQQLWPDWDEFGTDENKKIV